MSRKSSSHWCSYRLRTRACAVPVAQRFIVRFIYVHGTFIHAGTQSASFFENFSGTKSERRISGNETFPVRVCYTLNEAGGRAQLYLSSTSITWRSKMWRDSDLFFFTSKYNSRNYINWSASQVVDNVRRPAHIRWPQSGITRDDELQNKKKNGKWISSNTTSTVFLLFHPEPNNIFNVLFWTVWN